MQVRGRQGRKARPCVHAAIPRCITPHAHLMRLPVRLRTAPMPSQWLQRAPSPQSAFAPASLPRNTCIRNRVNSAQIRPRPVFGLAMSHLRYQSLANHSSCSLLARQRSAKHLHEGVATIQTPHAERGPGRPWWWGLRMGCVCVCRGKASLGADFEVDEAKHNHVIICRMGAQKYERRIERGPSVLVGRRK